MDERPIAAKQPEFDADLAVEMADDWQFAAAVDEFDAGIAAELAVEWRPLAAVLDDWRFDENGAAAVAG